MGSELQSLAKTFNGNCCTKNQQTVDVCNMTCRQPTVNHVKYWSSSEDDEFAMTDDNDDDEIKNKQPMFSINIESPHVIDAFKDAIEKGNDSLVKYYMNEFEAIDFINEAIWENGM